jgi:hypothetical protein
MGIARRQHSPGFLPLLPYSIVSSATALMRNGWAVRWEKPGSVPREPPPRLARCLLRATRSSRSHQKATRRSGKAAEKALGEDFLSTHGRKRLTPGILWAALRRRPPHAQLGAGRSTNRGLAGYGEEVEAEAGKKP